MGDFFIQCLRCNLGKKHKTGFPTLTTVLYPIVYLVGKFSKHLFHKLTSLFEVTNS